jgi:ABC-type bacteriocin/lantibiotic exporter with double-glycine peptidase domain
MDLGLPLAPLTPASENGPNLRPQRFVPLPSSVIRVPFVHQTQGYSCGAAAALMLLRYWRYDSFATVHESELYTELQTTQAEGTEPEPMVALFRRIGLDAEYRNGSVTVTDLERAVDAREPPVVDLQAWTDRTDPYADTWDAGHYVVMVGYDAERLYFADPSRATPKGYAYLNRSELEPRWHDLAGLANRKVERMAIFVRGSTRWTPDVALPDEATRLE